MSLAVASCFTACTALANPTGPNVVHGTAAILKNGNLLQITNSPNAIINWQSFSVGASEVTRFLQQSNSSAVLNRVITQNPSTILGALQSNGRVFLINPNGILFGAGAQIDVAGLVASTLNLSNADFLAGSLKFTEVPGAGSVVNQGNIAAGAGGQVYLVGPSVTNSGVITTPKGEVILAAGNSVELVNPGTPNLRVEITAADNQAVNLGQIVADAGRVGIYAGLINQAGTIQANSAVATEDGRIVLKATKNATLEAGSVTTANGPKGGSIEIQSGDTTLVAGTVEAKGAEGKGGSVQVLGNLVGLIDKASVDASGQTGGGTVLVGGDFQGKNREVQNAFRTYVGPDALVKADAVQSGDGGKVIVWADGDTRFYGQISARGGTQAGDGGFVEVSGKELLTYSGLVDTRAPQGQTGTLLLDPTDITISTADSTDSMTLPCGSSFSCDFHDETTTPSNLNVTTLTNQLGLSGVQISSNSGLTGNGDIDVNTPISYTSSNYLVFVAHRDINVNAGNNITNLGNGLIGFTAGDNINIAANVSTGGALSLGADGPVPGPVTFGVGAITRAATGNTLTAGTTLWLGAGSGITATTNAPAISFSNHSSGAVSISTTAGASNVSGSGGMTTLTASGPITLGDITSAGTLTVTALENTGVANNHVTVNAGATVSSGGDVILQAGDNIELLVGSAVRSGTGAVTLVSGFGNPDAFSAINLNGLVTAGTTVTLDARAGGAITSSSIITSGGNIAMTAGGNITLNSTTPGFIFATGSVSLQANAITQGNSGIDASQLTTISNAGASLSGANQVGSFTATNTTSGNISFTNAVPLTITGISSANGGTVTVNNTGALSITGTVSAGGGGGVNLASTGAMSESGGGLVSTTGTLTTNSVGGQTLNGANQVSSFSATNSTVGDISLTNTAGTLSLSGIAPAPGASVTINNTGSLVNVGTLTLSGGSSTFSTGGNSLTNAAGGVIQGNGTLNLGGAGKTLTNSGTLSPGTSPGALTINGDLTMTSSSITNIEIQSPGVTAGTDYDRINITGAAALDGTLNVTHLGGFSPSTGSFQIMTYATRSGDFVITNFPPGFSYNSLANATDYTLSLGPLFNTWIGTTGDWSVGTNWSFNHAPTSSEDAQIPDVAGAQTITVASGSPAAKSVVLVGDETLSLTGGILALTNASTINGTLSIAGGTLTTGALLNMNTLNLSAGAINGSGSLAVASGYTHTGGSINLGGGASITQALGNLVIGGPITAGSITATATNGTISQAAGAILSTAGQLTTSSVGGTTLNASNAVASFNATNASGGGIQFTNAASNKLTVTGMSQTGGNVNVIVTADDLDITGAVNAGSSAVTLRPTTLARNINMESTPTGGLSLSPSEIGFITAGTLEIGRSDGTGTLTVSTPVVAGNVNAGTLRLLDKDIAVSASVTSNGNLALNATNNVTVQNATVNAGGTMDVSATNNLSLTAVNAITNLLSTGAQTISAKGITLTGGGGTSTFLGAFISQTGAFTQSITAGSNGIILDAGNGTGGTNWAQINQSNAGGNQTIVVNGGDVAVLGGTGNASNNAGINNSGALQSITVNDAASVSVVAQTGPATITSSGNQTLTIQGAVSANVLSIGSAPSANSSIISGNNQNITVGANNTQSGTIQITGGVTYGVEASLHGNSGTQTVVATGPIQITGGTGTTGGNPPPGPSTAILNDGTGLQSITAGSIVLTGGASGLNNGAQIWERNASATGGQSITTTGSGGIVLQGGNGSGIANGAVIIQGGTTGNQTVIVGAGQLLTITGGTGTNNLAVITNSGSAQTITVDGNISLQGGASGTNNPASITALGGNQSITTNGNLVLEGGANGTANSAQISRTGGGGNQTIVVNGGNVSLLGGTGNVTNNASISNSGTSQSITVNDAASVSVVAQTGTASISSSGNQTLTIQGAASVNELSIGSATATNSSSITGNNQNITAGTGSQSGSITIRGGNTAGKPSVIRTNVGTQSVSTTGTLALTGGISTGGTSGCGPTGGACASISTNGTGLQHVTANKIDIKGGDIGGSTGSFGGAGIFVNAGNMQLDVGAGGLSMQAGDGAVAGNNFAQIGGSGAAGRTLTLNVTGNTTLTGGTTDQSSAFIGLTGTGNLQAITVNLNGTGDVTLTGGSSTNTGAVIGTGGNQTNATSTLTVSGKDITLNPGSTGEARIGHNSAAPGPGNLSVTATGNIALNGAGAVASAIRTTGNVTLQASGTSKTISEQSAGRIVANNLTAIADSGITLTGANNAVSNLAAKNNNAGAISFTNTTPLSIFNDAFASVNGLINTGRNVTLNNTGAVTQTAPITAAGLELLGAGPYTLTNGSNDITTLAANTTGAISYTDTNGLTVGMVNTTGITSGNNDVTINAGGTVAVTQNIAAGTGAVNITTTGATSNIDGGGGTISSTNGVTGITLNAGGGIGIGVAVNTNVTGGLGGLLNLTTNGADAAGNMTLVEAGALTFSPTGNANTNFVGAGTHTFTLTGSSITVGAGGGGCGSFCLNNNGTLITTAGDILLQNDTPIVFGTGAVQLVSAGDINVQSASVSAGTLSLSGQNLNVIANATPAVLTSGGALIVNAENVSLTGGNAQNAVAELRGGPVNMSIGNELTLIGGSGKDAHSLLFSNADFNLTIGSAIRLDAGTGSGAWAKMQTSSKNALFNINFTDVLSGGYFVNGVEGVIVRGTTGIFSGMRPARLGDTLIITYGP